MQSPETYADDCKDDPAMVGSRRARCSSPETQVDDGELAKPAR